MRATKARARTPWFQGTPQAAENQESDVSLGPPETVQKLRQALHVQAQGSPNQKFHSLYDKVYRSDVLAHAYDGCKAHGGAGGVEGQTFEDLEAYGVERWLSERAQELREKTFRPQPVRRAYIPQADGKQRPLGIPTIRDRVGQTAAWLVLEPIFEADLQPEPYAYRPRRSAWDALRHIHGLVNTGPTQVVDADLKGYFDAIPHTELRRSMARRVSDGTLLHPIKMGLRMPAQESDPKSGKRRTVPKNDERCGTPQGAPIHEMTERRWTWMEEQDQIRRLNRVWRSWSNYFGLGVVDRAYRAVDEQVRARLRRWLCTKHKISRSGFRPYPDDKLLAMGLVKLSLCRRASRG